MIWIISDKRWGDSDEIKWIAEFAHDPRPDAGPDESVWDRVQYRRIECATEQEAIRVAEKLKSNVVNVASVYKKDLERVEGKSYDWRVASEPIEVECIFDRQAVGTGS